MLRTPSHHPSSPPALPPGPATRAALEFVHGLLTTPAGPLTLESVLPGLARAFAARGAGLASLVDGGPVVRFWTAADGETLPPVRWPWDEQPEILAETRRAATAVPVHTLRGSQFLLTAGGPVADGWLLWLEGPADPAWSSGERAALQLAGLALERLLQGPAGRAAWTRWQERARVRQRLADATAVVGRLAHDFGNVLTGILGFTELGLNEAAPGTALHRYLHEVYDSAQRGARLTARLKQLGQRPMPHTRPTALATIVLEEEARVRPQWGKCVALHVALPSQLPQLAIDPEPLRGILGPLLDNAREAIPAEGVVTLSARPVDLTEADCADLLGSPTPGPHVEVTLTDSGSGFTPAARRAAFVEPFFTTKPRHRGIGLTAVHSLLHAQRSGACLEPDAERGTVLRVYLPVAPTPADTAPGAGSLAGERERVLIVETDPLILQLMTATLDGAGYRVQAAPDGGRALEQFTAATEPFQLVLADVALPHMTGFDLVRQLLARNPALRILFTSSYVPADPPGDAFAGREFDLLPKPFRPDGLVRAVRAALDRPPHGPGTASVSGDKAVPPAATQSDLTRRISW